MGDGSVMGEEWTCCNDEQTLFILLYIAYAALAIITWQSIIAKPMRLIAVCYMLLDTSCLFRVQK
jgi:hypothetical protein